jgi:hypothetical protein
MFTKLPLERYYPAGLGVCGLLVACFADWTIPAQVSKELLGALISATSILAGFLTTAMTILLPIGSTEIGRRLKRRNKLNFLHSYLRAAIWSCLLLLVICVVCFFLVVPQEQAVRPKSVTWHFGSVIVIGAGIYCAATVARIVHIIYKIFVAISSEVPEPKPNDRS